ncbi:amidase [Peribacillus sp. SCS-155]|uniref:amidase n=1 Tax=Peribacillus sedimenti TaxID=3115297 RepID=UPI0039060B2C
MKGFVYTDYDGVGLAELIKSRQISQMELAEAAISEIEKKNPKLNAVIHKMYDQARTKAAQNDCSGEFAGVPVLIKDITQEIKGEPMTSGSKALKGYIAKDDSAFVKKLRDTGTLFLGQTNVPELALMAITEPALHGATRNPWNTEYTPGGSSGGSGAAVASGMVPIAGANDGGGSIRIPAAFNGLFGLKPSRGRTPVGKTLGRQWQGASVDHVLTRSVRDSALMLDLLHGLEKGAAFPSLPFDGSYLEASKTPIEKPLRIAYSTVSPIGTEVHPECKNAVIHTAKILESLGYIVEEKEAPVDGKKIANSYITMYFGEVAAAIATMEDTLGRKPTFKDVEPTTWLLGLIGQSTNVGEWVLNMREWDRAAFAMEEFFETYDFYITPTTAYPPSKIGELDPSLSEKLLMSIIGRLKMGSLLKKTGMIDQLVENSLKRTPFTQLANLTGQPAMSVPLHATPEGMPVGVQFVAARGEEHRLYQMAGMLEQHHSWLDVKKNPMFHSLMDI